MSSNGLHLKFGNRQWQSHSYLDLTALRNRRTLPRHVIFVRLHLRFAKALHPTLNNDTVHQTSTLNCCAFIIECAFRKGEHDYIGTREIFWSRTNEGVNNKSDT